ncbi:LrgB family protein [Pseudoalteromonas sp. SMS1]|uniref:LrgB family protein n=1 Tax=Pseudoalteromonas sp. SMS1 TaxID=2908894 RepID=UPI001F35F6E0|nr:LrgB family protein [Pseudoalteromonas sp. SMS1]MCF2856288.1 LrgB family protein [Pseudoalteromonas sp. SMS1]
MISVFACLLTVGLFTFTRAVHKCYSTPLLNPVLLCIVSIAILLVASNVSYTDYYLASMPINVLLEPAIVALAYPLYSQFTAIRPVLILLIVSAFLGISVATLMAYMLCLLFNAEPTLVASLMALSVTTPITLLITDALGGLPSIAAVMVILIGIVGSVFGLSLLQLCNISQPQAKGIALGVGCHAIGTAAAMEYDPQAGAFASAAMIISAIISAFWVPIFFTILNSLSG